MLRLVDGSRGDQVVVRRELLATRLDARDVGSRLDAERADAHHELDGCLARLGPRTGHRDEARSEGLQRLDGAQQGGFAVARPRGKELERDAGPAAGEDVGDLHRAPDAAGALAFA